MFKYCVLLLSLFSLPLQAAHVALTNLTPAEKEGAVYEIIDQLKYDNNLLKQRVFTNYRRMGDTITMWYGDRVIGTYTEALNGKQSLYEPHGQKWKDSLVFSRPIFTLFRLNQIEKVTGNFIRMESMGGKILVAAPVTVTIEDLSMNPLLTQYTYQYEIGEISYVRIEVRKKGYRLPLEIIFQEFKKDEIHPTSHVEYLRD